MKKIYKAFVAAALVVPALLTTGCIEEVFPTNGATQEQLNGNSKATEALVWAMPAHMNQVFTVPSEQHWDWGKGAIMHGLDCMTADMAIVYSSYNHFNTWCAANIGLNDGYLVCQFIWNFQTEQVLTANKVVGAIDPATTDPDLMAYLGQGLAFRASTYLDMARMYEFLPNNYVPATNTFGNDVTGYTVPIVTDKTTEEQARNNPRAKHDEMVKFIRTDLEQAIPLLQKGTARTSKTVPNLGVCYGLMARLYLWDATYHEQGLPYAGEGTAAELYQKAAQYARLAISTSNATPMTRNEALNTQSGFNDLRVSSWMWGMQLTDEDNAVKTGIINWASWMSNETSFGYASAGPMVMIGANVYRRINDRDWRKLMFIAPTSSPLSGRESLINEEQRKDLPTYASLKFRPGEGNIDDYKVGAVVGIPLMRVEEMYFIEAEATAHTNPTGGLELCTSFMQKFRYATYRSNASTPEDIIDEIVFQKRVELFGEGQAYYDYKRLNMSVDRTYSGTNFNWGRDTYNSVGRPSWMNYVITQQETDANRALEKWNNPNVGGKQSVLTGQ